MKLGDLKDGFDSFIASTSLFWYLRDIAEFIRLIASSGYLAMILVKSMNLKESPASLNSFIDL